MGLTHRQVYCVLRQELRKGVASQLWERAELLRREGMGWSYDGLGSWTNEAIFDQLCKLGVDTSPEQFRPQAIEVGRCFVLEDRWRNGLHLEHSPWEDFPFLAAEELWRRLTPDLLCPEVVASYLEGVLDQVSANRSRPTSGMEKADVAAVLLAMDYLAGFPAEQRKAKFEELQDCTIYDFDGWFLDFVLDYGKEHPDEVTRVADVMSGFSQPDNYLGDLAISLARAGRYEEACRRVAENLDRFPRDVWIHIRAGDVHEELNDHENALQAWMTALRMAAKPYDWDGAAERIEPLLEQLGRHEEWTAIKRQHPRPRSSPGNIGVLTSEPSPRLVPAQPALLFSGEKTGRNDPCPCGSGKKYKKCCMGRD